MKLTDGKKTVEIELKNDNGIDWSAEFFEAGALEYDEAQDTYMVDDVQYCIDQAIDYIHGVSDTGIFPRDGEYIIIDGNIIEQDAE